MSERDDIIAQMGRSPRHSQPLRDNWQVSSPDSDPSDLVVAAYREVLLRDPDPGGLEHHREQVSQGITWYELCDALRRSWEHQALVVPLMAEVERTYRSVLFRAPLPHELRRHMDAFRASVSSAQGASDEIQQAGALRHLDIRPLWAEMDVTNQCNLRCLMCYFSDERVHRRKRRDFSIAEFGILAAQLFPLCYKASLSFGAEPLLHPRLSDCVLLAKKQRVPWVYLYTNGMGLDVPKIESLIAAGLDMIAVSVDAATPSLYERIRRGARFERLKNNLRLLREVKAARGVSLPRVAFSVVLMRSTIEELPKLIRLAAEEGISEIGTCHLVPYSAELHEESLHFHRSLFNRVADEARDLAEHLGVAVTLPPKFRDGTTPSPIEVGISTPDPSDPGGRDESGCEAAPWLCRFPWSFVGVDAYGNVLPCGWWYSEQPMGNLISEGFEDVWNGSRYAQLREELQSGRPRASCRSCPAAGAGSVDDQQAFRPRSVVGEES